jgi:hypothetical protein
MNIFNNLDFLPSQDKDIPQSAEAKTVEDEVTKIHSLSTSRAGENSITLQWQAA